MIISLKNLLLQGQFGENIHFISTPKQVIAELGDAFILDHTPESGLDLIYGHYVFSFLSWKTSIHKISLDFARKNPNVFAFQNERFEVDAWIFKGNQPISFQKAQHLLHLQSIPYKPTQHPHHHTPAIRLQSGGLLYFDTLEENGKVWYLDGFLLEAYQML